MKIQHTDCHFANSVTNFLGQRFIFKGGEAPSGRGEAVEAAREKPSKGQESTPEQRQALYAKVEAKINNLKAKGTKASERRAERLQKALAMARQEEVDPTGTIESAAADLRRTLNHILRAEQAPPMSDKRAGIISSDLDKQMAAMNATLQQETGVGQKPGALAQGEGSADTKKSNI